MMYDRVIENVKNGKENTKGTLEDATSVSVQ